MNVNLLARAPGFLVRDYRCSAGPRDRPFEEAHTCSCVALVLSGTFRYRSTGGAAALVPGAMLLGNPGQAYECSHEHSTGDRCLSFHFAPELLEGIARDLRRPTLRLARLDVPAHPKSAALVARGRAAAAAGSPGTATGAAGTAAAAPAAANASPVSLEELAYDVAALALSAADGQDAAVAAPVTATDARRAAQAACHLEAHAADEVSLADLAAHVGVSAFHLLRTFRRVLGVTPHQYLIGARVARAAELLLTSTRDVTDVAYASGFGDLSNFMRSFRAAAGRSPGAFRRAHLRS